MQTNRDAGHGRVDAARRRDPLVYPFCYRAHPCRRRPPIGCPRSILRVPSGTGILSRSSEPGDGHAAGPVQAAAYRLRATSQTIRRPASRWSAGTTLTLIGGQDRAAGEASPKRGPPIRTILATPILRPLPAPAVGQQSIGRCPVNDPQPGGSWRVVQVSSTGLAWAGLSTTRMSWPSWSLYWAVMLTPASANRLQSSPS